ncbi:SGNH/GDSL hydrolase family protein [Stenotrophomonas sp. SMYL86]|uniref:SGNH/GDSL hydrolase family protein n=1 Tax=Stenotrophomonas sp. SMYL86 TaxID=3076044 RepID=UPI002E78FA09|nr:SGNH/GDSL hydrolase family protein [Stenotrophomonas sp. SMYL86]
MATIDGRQIIPAADLPQRSAGVLDAMVGVVRTSGALAAFPLTDLPTPRTAQAEIDSLKAGQSTSAIYADTLTNLQAIVGAFEGQGGFVLNGPDAGQYRWSGAAWVFLRADSLAALQDEIKSFPSALSTLSLWAAHALTKQPGYVINKDTGAVSASANFFYAYAELTGAEVGVRITASLSQPVQALAVYKDSIGRYLGYEVAGTTAETLYTDFVLQHVPAQARSVHVSSRRDNIAISVATVQGDVAKRLASAEVGVSQAIETSAAANDALSSWESRPMSSFPGFYIDKTSGNPVASSAYNYKSLDLLGTEGAIRFTTLVTGTATTAVAFYNAAGSLIGVYGNPSTQYTDQEIPVPTTARKVSITARDGNSIDAKLRRVAANVAERLNKVESASSSSWAGQKSASFGDSLVQQNRWQPLVAKVHGIVDANCGVGGSKIAKPDASASVISMCDDTRIAAIPADTALILFEGGTNDWAQSVPLGSFNSELNTEFYGALHSTIGKLLTRFPQARIFCITSPYGERITVPSNWPNGWTNAIGLTVRAYAEATRRVAEHYGLPVIEWSRECGWSHANVAQFLDNDGAFFHPSAAVGAPLLARIVNGRLWDIQR